MKNLFISGLLPSAAHKEFMRQLKSECSDDLEYHLKLADRSIFPRRMDFNIAYGKFTKSAYGTTNLKEMYKQLDSRIKALKEKDSDYTLACQEFEEENNQSFILVILTPLLKNVHKLVSVYK